ncbi:MAG: restriction endonuclease subunit S [Methanobrevibacter sp.]|nr:restriction endonuclease subunit S [Methanobrevibacter sp.]
MSLEWKTVELKSIANVTMGQSPKSEFYNDNFEGMPFLQGNKTFGDKYPSFELYTTSIKKVAEKNSVLMSVRAPVGDLNIAQEDICIGRGVCGLQMKKGDNEFLYYLLKANISHLINKESGTVFGSINKNDIETFEVTLPKSSDDQMKILTILKNIDKKIDICKNLNINLEEQIETVYNSFFVYYDDFSIDELEECEIGLIPKEWDLLSLGEVTTQIKEKVGKNDYKVFSAVNTGNLILSEEYFDKQVFSKSIEKYIVVKQKEFAYNPARVNIGSIGRNDFDYDGCVSPVYVAFKVEEGYENFVNMFIKSKRFNQWVVTLASGSVRQTLNYTDFSIIKIAYPPKDLIEKFNIIYESYYEVINHNNSMISNLEKIRDILLPKLMSGEIDVSEINCDLE